MASFRSKLKMSDEIFDYICTTCAEKNLTREAIKYCLECQRYFCQVCVAAHERILKGHTLMDSSAGLSPGQQSWLPSFQTDQCSNHKGKILDMYCGKHKVVCCYICVAKDHKSCEIHSIVDDIDKLYNKSDTDRTKHDLTDILDTMDDRRKATHILLQQLRDSKTSAFQAVKDYRAEMDKYLDNLEDASIKEIEREYRNMESELLEERNTFEKFIEALKKLEDLLTKTKENKPQQFVCTNLAQHNMTKAEYKCNWTSKSSIELSYIPNEVLRQLMHGVTSLGKAAVKTISTKDKLYKARLIETLDIKVKNDRFSCGISGACIVDDIVLFSDWVNKKLKRINVSTLDVVDSCQLKDCPNGVCRVGTQEVAIACSTMVQFVSVHGKLVVLRKLKMKHRCYGIAYKNDKLYITDEDKSLYMYDMSGKLLKTVATNAREQPLFQRSNHIVFTDIGERMFVGDDQKGLVCFDARCEHVTTIDNPLAKADGVCVDGLGNIIVVALWSHCIAQFSQDGEKLGVIVSKTVCLRHHNSMCFHKGLNRLFVTNGSDQVQVYQLY